MNATTGIHAGISTFPGVISGNQFDHVVEIEAILELSTHFKFAIRFARGSTREEPINDPDCLSTQQTTPDLHLGGHAVKGPTPSVPSTP